MTNETLSRHFQEMLAQFSARQASRANVASPGLQKKFAQSTKKATKAKQEGFHLEIFRSLEKENTRMNKWKKQIVYTRRSALSSKYSERIVCMYTHTHTYISRVYGIKGYDVFAFERAHCLNNTIVLQRELLSAVGIHGSRKKAWKKKVLPKKHLICTK